MISAINVGGRSSMMAALQTHLGTLDGAQFKVIPFMNDVAPTNSFIAGADLATGDFSPAGAFLDTGSMTFAASDVALVLDSKNQFQLVPPTDFRALVTTVPDAGGFIYGYVVQTSVAPDGFQFAVRFDEPIPIVVLSQLIQFECPVVLNNDIGGV